MLTKCLVALVFSSCSELWILRIASRMLANKCHITGIDCFTAVQIPSCNWKDSASLSQTKTQVLACKEDKGYVRTVVS